MKNVISLIKQIPKIELHLHIEGTLEPEMMMKIAKRNSIELPFTSISEAKSAYQFSNLQSFLDVYYLGANVLLYEQDFYDMTYAYLEKMHQENVKHVEIFFDPQTHTARGVDFSVVLNGINKALKDAKSQFNLSSHLIMCFLRHLSEEDAIKTYQQALPYFDTIIGVGLDSSEQNNPPEKFKSVFKMAQSDGLKLVAHAGEEGPPDYIWQAIQLLGASRIDHGVRAIEDKNLIQYLVEHQIPLTICPLSNKALCICPDLIQHPLKRLLEAGVCVTINSDDPAYFGGYLTENYFTIVDALNLDDKHIHRLAINSVKASFLDHDKKEKFINQINNMTEAPHNF